MGTVAALEQTFLLSQAPICRAYVKKHKLFRFGAIVPQQCGYQGTHGKLIQIILTQFWMEHVNYGTLGSRSDVRQVRVEIPAFVMDVYAEDKNSAH